jgi:hypothetical protein
MYCLAEMTDVLFMGAHVLGSVLGRWTKGLVALAFLSGTMLAQGVSVATLHDDVPDSGPLGSGVMAASPAPAEAPRQHEFWDKQNRVLFATVAALSAADFAVTRTILQNGGKELNPVTRAFSASTAGLAANFAGETAGVIALSYCFHRTGHHRPERITSMLDIGTSSFAVAYDLSHR